LSGAQSPFKKKGGKKWKTKTKESADGKVAQDFLGQ
jgi:hypothetical protein